MEREMKEMGVLREPESDESTPQEDVIADEEKHIEHDSARGLGPGFAPIQTARSNRSTPIMSRSTSRPTSRPGSLRQVRSYGGEDGYCVFSEDEREEPHETEADPEKEFEVRWDGEDDPMNPKSMHKARKWAIVLICAASALCV